LAKDTVFYIKKTLNLSGNITTLDEPVVMGILNVTPDSFFDGGRYTTESEILSQAGKMLNEGADILDVGGYSSRPAAEDISEEEELKRAIFAIKIIRKSFPQAIISVDTFRAKVAKAAVGEGASIINDISGGSLDPLMFDTVKSLKVPYILMHMKGSPQTMKSLATYSDMLGEMLAYFLEKITELRHHGVADIIIDPGFGFAKSIDQNYELLKKLEYFKVLNLPICVGLSRKSMIHKRLGIQPEDSLNGSVVLNTLALTKGANILRVHDVKETKEAIKLYKLSS
jgi:dihydropteroate synthase